MSNLTGKFVREIFEWTDAGTPNLSELPITDNCKAAMELKKRLDSCLLSARNKLGLALPYEIQRDYITVYFDTAKQKPYCMIKINTGGIFRMTSHNAHSPGERGTIYDDDYGVNCLETNGPRKFKDGIPTGTRLEYRPRPNRKKRNV
jgi:hypothetical protein